MASCNLNYDGHTGVINADAYVYEITTSGTSRRVRLVLEVYAVDYSGARDASYSVRCSQSGTNVSVGLYQGFTISGTARTIFDQTFWVDMAKGSDRAAVDLSFSASLVSPSSGTRSISGTITTLYLTMEPDTPAVAASRITLSAGSVQMGKNLLVSIQRDNSGCTHTLAYRFGSTETRMAENVASSYAATVPDVANLCENALSLPCQVVCYTYYGGSCIGSTSAGLTLTVPEATVPTLPGSELTLGQSCEISCRRNSRYFTQKAELSFQGTTAAIGNGKQDAFSWTPGYDLAKQIPALTQATGTLVCHTYNGTALVGSNSVTVRLTVPENDITRPRVESLSLSPVSDLGQDFAGVYIRGKTGLRAEITAVSDYSRIQSYELTAGSLQTGGNPAVLELLVSEEAVKVTARVTDERGFAGTYTTTIQVLPYRNPRVTPASGYSQVVCERATETGQLSTGGSYLAIRAGRAWSSVPVNGEEKNSCTLRYRWKISGGSYSQWIPLLEAREGETEISVLVGNVVTSLQSSYTVQLQAIDALGGSHTLSFPIMTEAVSFVLYDGEDGAGFGKYPEQPHVVDIASHMTLLVRGPLVVEGAGWISLGLAETVAESAYDWGHQESPGCHYQVWGGSHVYLAFDCSFSYGGTAVVINDSPIPESCRPRRRVYSLCPAGDRCLVLVSADPDGWIRAEWVRRLTDTAATVTAAVTWLDGYLDYWI